MPKPTLDQLERYYAKDRSEWRRWLEKNHASSPGVWLIYYKQTTGQPHVEYSDAVEEALCFGWIDSKSNTLDNERYMQLFSPRNPKSPWSRLNKQRVEKLIEQDLMTEAGLKPIEAAKQNGAWTVYDTIEDLTMPEDLEKALSANPTADTNFQAFSNSSKKNILWWIQSAKQPATRSKRIEETVTLAAINKKANHYRQ
ncbi:MAG: YdeI/OmpD-associated family protein [Ktedonobacteraceae bacterium]|nr:YdeI/OmpD-associated family protein [Ktedonobacteraceae bacterium]